MHSYMVLLDLYSYADIASWRLLYMAGYLNEIQKCKVYGLLSRINLPKLIPKLNIYNPRSSQNCIPASAFISGVPFNAVL